MTTIVLRARGPRPAADVWERYANPGRWSTWAPHIRRVDVDDERLTAGTSGRVVGPLAAYADFTVDTWDDVARTWSWTVWPGPVGRPVLRLGHGVAPYGPGSETWLELTGPLPVTLAYLPLARLALHRLVH